MSAPCPTCQAVIASCPNDDALYSIQSALFPWVFECPAGYDCGNAPGFKMVCCGTLFEVDFPTGASADLKTTLIQSIVNQCTVLLAACGQNPGCLNPPCDPPPPTTTLYYNRDATCEAKCPDGTPFFYTVVAGTFADLTQEGADQKALDYACQQVPLRRVCMTAFTNCLCVDAPYSRSIVAIGGLPPIRFTLASGSLPTGLTLSINGLISGTPTASGVFHFAVKATTGDGGSSTKSFTLSVMEITTTSIPGYTIGTAYTYQMLAAGGSGMYNWTITSGSLPDGLSMNDTGLISGTPTGGPGSGTVEFKLIDTTCETAVQTLQRPSIAMTTKSTTQIATVRGFPEYSQFVSFPPKRYKRLTWTGTSEHRLFWLGFDGQSHFQAAAARIIYSGTSEIDALGRYVSLYQKNRFVWCDKALPQSFYTSVPFQIGILQVGAALVYNFIGWCGVPGHQVCPPCDPTTEFTFLDNIAYGRGDAAINDFSLLWGSDQLNANIGIGRSKFVQQSATLATCNDVRGASDPAGNGLPTYFDPIPNNQPIQPLVTSTAFEGSPEWDHNYSATLDTEYTDAEALANAQVFSGTGVTAQNRPRTTSFVSSFTGVVFTLTASNLVVGSNYLISVDFWDAGAGTTTTRQYGITPTTTTHSITDVVPTPLPQHALTVRNPRIAFAP